VNEFVQQLCADGHTVEAVDFEYLDYIVPAYYILTTAEASSNLARYDGIRYGFRVNGYSKDVEKKFELTDLYRDTRSAGFGKEVKRRIMLGTFVLERGLLRCVFLRKRKQVRQLLTAKPNWFSISTTPSFYPLPLVPLFRLGEKLDDPISMYLADYFYSFCKSYWYSLHFYPAFLAQ